MKRTKTTEIIIETDEVFVVRAGVAAPPQAAALWCGGCGAESAMLAPEAAARAAGTSARHVYRLVEAGRVHFAETHDGALLVCLSSLGPQAPAPDGRPALPHGPATTTDET